MKTPLTRRRLTPDQVAWLAALYPGEDRNDVAFALGITEKQVSTCARSRDIAKVVRHHRHFDAMADAWLIALYPDLRGQDVAAALGFSATAIYFRAAKLGIKKSAEFKASDLSARIRRGQTIGREFWFKPGHVSHNKGRKGWHAPGCEKGWFKPGHQRNDTKPIGAERLDTKGGYVLIKVSPEEQGAKALAWQPKHRILWERANGPVPAGHVLACIDGNKTNPSNWQPITLAENMKRSTVHNYPAPLKQAIQLAGALKRKINGIDRKQASHAAGD